jgi:hypothetical protein
MALKNIIKLSKETGYKLETDWIETCIKTLPEKIFSRFYRKETDLIADSTDLSATGGRFRAGTGNCPGPGGKAAYDRFQALRGPQAQIRYRLRQ